MLFNEVYGSYYNVIAAILERAVAGGADERCINEIVRERAFGESILTIPAALRNKDWPLLDADNRTPLAHAPSMPLTTLQRRWLKALLRDPRIGLFEPSEEGLADVEPLYPAGVFNYYDRHADGDPYADEGYKQHFRTILAALREARKLRICFIDNRGERHEAEYVPHRLEYSSKDDRFRLLAQTDAGARTVNLARIEICELAEPWSEAEYRAAEPVRKTLVLELTDERNALERVMLHFSHMEKETERICGDRYRLTLRYDADDETELLIRVLSFGPMLRAVSPEEFVEKIRRRLQKQQELRV